MKTYRTEHDEMLDALRKALDKAGKLDPRERFRRLVASGIIDEQGRLRREITGLPSDDETDDEASPLSK